MIVSACVGQESIESGMPSLSVSVGGTTSGQPSESWKPLIVSACVGH
ncbi:hypothetical protein NMT12_60253 [metagenome]